MPSGAYVMNLGRVSYEEAWDLQRSLAAAVARGAVPETVIFVEHPATITLGRRTDPGEVHVPDGADVEVVETDRGGRSTYHGPGQLVCYPILDLKQHGKDVKRFCRDLEEAVIRAVAPFGIEATRIEGLTGVWVPRSRVRRGSSPRSASTSRAGSRPTDTRSTSTSTRPRSPTGSPRAASRTRHSPRWRVSSGGL